jgi:5-methylcytosine-specific restriction protein B
MARFEGANAVYEAAQLFREGCLERDGSLLADDASIWSQVNLKALKRCFVDTPDTGKRSFMDKFRDQLAPAPAAIKRLAGEALAIYFLFPTKVTGAHKLKVVNDVLGWAGEKLEQESALAVAFQGGIGGAGQGYNTRRPYELGYLVELMLAWKGLSAEQRRDHLTDPWLFRSLAIDVENGAAKQLRHMLLHMLFPDHFERIGSARQKAQLVGVFKDLAGKQETHEDQQLLTIRTALEATFAGALDYYRAPLVALWYDSEDGEDDNEPSLELVEYKRQIVLYGPPGTGKTYRAKQLGRKLIHTAALRRDGIGHYINAIAEVDATCASNIHRLQLHPAYGYEDFVRGLHIGASGATEYRPGYLLRLIAQMNTIPREDRLPHVLILDEMNRTDLSRMLGECFSLLENRNEVVELPGQGADGATMTLSIPDDLYIIGTMNLIDQSVEQLDFALRRRFLWFHCGFNGDALLAAAEALWSARPSKVQWSEVAEDFALLAAAAANLNAQIHESNVLGPQYEIGHTYLLDVVEFLRGSLAARTRVMLWNNKGEPTEPVRRVWRLSLRPLLEQYLGGLDTATRTKELTALETAFLQPKGRR